MRFLAYLLLIACLAGSGWAAWFFLGENLQRKEDPELIALKRQVAVLDERIAKGDLKAEVDLAWIYGRKGSKLADPEKAVALFRKAAKRGNADAQYGLGLMHAEGRGTARDYIRAAQWWRVAADAGHQADAEFRLAELYFKGRGVANDYEKAVTYYRRAAEGGQPVAQYMIGLMYMDGWGVRRDPVEAYKWLTLALRAADTVAAYNPDYKPRAKRETLLAELNSTQINEGEKLAREFRPRR